MMCVEIRGGLVQSIRLTYISKSNVTEKRPSIELVELIKSISRHDDAVTGGLIVAGSHIAQTIEGEESIVQALADDIFSDPRHELCAVIERRPIETRLFSEWTFGYSGASIFMSGIIGDCLNTFGDARERNVANLLKLMSELERAPIGVS